MPQDSVILLHGIFRTRLSMQGMARFLEKRGYRVLNVGYPSTRYKIEELVEWLHPRVEAFVSGTSGRVHWVGHSMGGLLIRAYLHRHHPQNMGRVVMLGTPNHGSEVADFVQHWWLYKKLYGPAGQQLVTKPQVRTHLFGAVGYELGVIAGNRTLDPLGSHIIGHPNDGKVSVQSTKLEEMKDHIILPVGHVFLPDYRVVKQQALAFLEQGHFAR